MGIRLISMGYFEKILAETSYTVSVPYGDQVNFNGQSKGMNVFKKNVSVPYGDQVNFN